MLPVVEGLSYPKWVQFSLLECGWLSEILLRSRALSPPVLLTRFDQVLSETLVRLKA